MQILKTHLIREGFIFLLCGVLLSCGKSLNPKKGDLVGVPSKRWVQERPYGMTLVPQGTFVMGKASENMTRLEDSPLKTVSMTSFYMDETEITNSEYRQFVYWVRDSIIRTSLARAAEQKGLTPKDKRSIGRYAYRDADTTKMSVYRKYLNETHPDQSRKYLNWEVPLIWNTNDYIDKDYARIMDSLYLPASETTNGVRMVNTSMLDFTYAWFDSENMARSASKNRKEFLKKETVKVYPDTLVWITDFNYSYNEPRHNEYFYHDAYSDYPVVGVNWFQAKAFCSWRTLFKYINQKEKGELFGADFRLPTEAEWEYAAAGGLRDARYPWGGPYTLNDRGYYLANFKPLRGDYAVDGGLYTTKTATYLPNGFDLYDMAGNVSEWTNSVYYPNSYIFVFDINPNITNFEQKKKVVRGGSWKDVAYYLEINTRDFEYADSSRSYIGFRTIQDYLGGSEGGFDVAGK